MPDLTPEEIAERARVKDIKDRWYAISDIRICLLKASVNMPNPEMELRRIIVENDQTALTNLENKWSEAQSEFTQREADNAAFKTELEQVKLAVSLINDDPDMKPYVKKILKALIRKVIN